MRMLPAPKSRRRAASARSRSRPTKLSSTSRRSICDSGVGIRRPLIARTAEADNLLQFDDRPHDGWLRDVEELGCARC